MATTNPNILLIGPRGCGKTTVGALLADRLGRPFLDLDDVVLGSFDEPSVRDVWQRRGEAAWRAAEVEALERVLSTAARVVALGGGVPMLEPARDAIEGDRAAGRALVIYLQCEPATLARRLRAVPGDRPSLTGLALEAEVAKVLARRRPTYLALADHAVDASTSSPESIAARIETLLPRSGDQGCRRPSGEG